MALLTPTPITRAGVNVTTLIAAAAGGDTYAASASPYLEFLNSSAGAITVNAAIYADGQTIATGRTWSIPAGQRIRIQPMTGAYTNPSDGLCYLTYSAVTTFFVGIFTG